MDQFVIQLLFAFLPAIFWGIIVALLARRKNLNLWLWAGLAVIGVFLLGIFFILAELIVMAFMPYKCPKCKAPLRGKDEISKKICPACDLVQAFGEDGPPALNRP